VALPDEIAIVFEWVLPGDLGRDGAVFNGPIGWVESFPATQSLAVEDRNKTIVVGRQKRGSEQAEKENCQDALHRTPMITSIVN
jgi:hypothetical protein